MAPQWRMGSTNSWFTRLTCLPIIKFERYNCLCCACRYFTMLLRLQQVDPKQFRDSDAQYLTFHSERWQGITKSNFPGGFCCIPKDCFFIKTTLCSTKFTQDADLLELLQWATKLKNIAEANVQMHSEVSELKQTFPTILTELMLYWVLITRYIFYFVGWATSTDSIIVGKFEGHFTQSTKGERWGNCEISDGRIRRFIFNFGRPSRLHCNGITIRTQLTVWRNHGSYRT